MLKRYLDKQPEEGILTPLNLVFVCCRFVRMMMDLYVYGLVVYYFIFIVRRRL